MKRRNHHKAVLPVIKPRIHCGNKEKHNDWNSEAIFRFISAIRSQKLHELLKIYDAILIIFIFIT